MSTPPTTRASSGGGRRTRGRHPVTPDGLTKWVVIADACGLSERQVKRVFARAIAKVRVECDRMGIGYDELAAYLAARDTTAMLDLPSALIPDGEDLVGLVDDE